MLHFWTMSNYKIRSKSELEKQCPNCRRPITKRPDFCLECGDFVTPVFVRTGAGTKTGAITAPLRRPPARRHSRAVFLAGLLLTLAVGGIVIVTIMDVFKGLGGSGKNALVLAAKYLARGEDENAINVLDRSLQEEKPVKGDQRQAVLDHALFNLAGKLATQGKYRDAVTCYSRISSGFERREEVDQLIAEYSDKSLPIFGVTENHQQTGGKSVALSRLEKAVQTVVPPTTTSTAPPAAPIQAAPVPQTASPAQPVVQAAGQPRPEAEDSQTLLMSRYNELLAGYFSHRKRSAGEGAGAEEPPSFDEWVKGGGKDF